MNVIHGINPGSPENFDNQSQHLSIVDGLGINERYGRPDPRLRSPEEVLAQFSMHKQEFEAELSAALEEAHQNRSDPLLSRLISIKNVQVPTEISIPEPMVRPVHDESSSNIESMKRRIEIQNNLIADLQQQHRQAIDEWHEYEERVNIWKEGVMKSVEQIKTDAKDLQVLRQENLKLRAKVKERTGVIIKLRDAMSKIHLNYFMGKTPHK